MHNSTEDNKIILPNPLCEIQQLRVSESYFFKATVTIKTSTKLVIRSAFSLTEERTDQSHIAQDDHQAE
jgi:hypothetical protein